MAHEDRMVRSFESATHFDFKSGFDTPINKRIEPFIFSDGDNLREVQKKASISCAKSPDILPSQVETGAGELSNVCRSAFNSIISSRDGTNNSNTFTTTTN